jgi:hypothetical protein
MLSRSGGFSLSPRPSFSRSQVLFGLIHFSEENEAGAKRNKNCLSEQRERVFLFPRRRIFRTPGNEFSLDSLVTFSSRRK